MLSPSVLRQYQSPWPDPAACGGRFLILLTLPTGAACRLVLRETSAISSVILVNHLPFSDPSARARRATPLVMVASVVSQ